MTQGKRRTVVDFYLAFPLFVDAIICIIIIIINTQFSVFNFKFLESNDLQNFISNLIGAEVSLAGFILAALTIIVTFKSNIKAKGLEEAGNALEMILSSTHYPKIVRVFKLSIIELLVLIIACYTIWLSFKNIDVKTFNILLICAVFSTIAAILRTLYVLFIALEMEKHSTR